MLYLGIDVGASNIVAAVVDDNMALRSKKKSKVRCGCEKFDLCALICDTALDALDAANVTAADCEYCGIGCPGAIDPGCGKLVYAANLGIGDIPVAKLVSERLGIPAYIANDANCAALGEVCAGAAKGASNALIVTLGTGIGGGIIIGGRIYSGINGLAGEIGHMLLYPGGEQCACGRRGCWETYASATALKRQTRKAMTEHPDSLMWKISPSLDKVSGLTSFSAARQGDKAAEKVVDTYLGYVAEGLINCINILQPDVVCIGGGISNEGDSLIDRLRGYIEQYRFGINNIKHPRLACAALGGDAGLIGAAMLGKQIREKNDE